MLVVVVKAMPGIEDEAAGAVFAEFKLFEDSECFVDAAGTAYIFRVEDVAKLVG